METSEDRGIECKGLCFSYVDGNVILSVYQNLPGIRRDLAGTIFQKTFSGDEWSKINHYLDDSEMRGVILGEDDVIEIDSEGKVHPPEAVKVLSDISQLRKEDIVADLAQEEITTIYSKRIDTSVPSTTLLNIPSMTKEKKEEANDGEE